MTTVASRDILSVESAYHKKFVWTFAFLALAGPYGCHFEYLLEQCHMLIAYSLWINSHPM